VVLKVTGSNPVIRPFNNYQLFLCKVINALNGYLNIKLKSGRLKTKSCTEYSYAGMYNNP
jgi:hypothetical protein